MQPVEPIKIIVVGEIGAGKTSLAKRYVNGLFSKNTKSSIGVDFLGKEYKIIRPEFDGLFAENTVHLQFWDIAGQERFGSMMRVYYKNAHGGLVVCDVTNQTNFDNTKTWKKDIDTNVMFPNSNTPNSNTPNSDTPNSGTPIPVVLIGSKIDLCDERVIQTEDLRKKAEDDGYIGFGETSAINGHGIAEAVDLLVADILKKMKLYPKRFVEDNQTLKLDPHPDEKNETKCFDCT